MAKFVNKEEWNILDLLSIMNMMIGLTNLESNMTNEDLSENLQSLLKDVHTHLAEQDHKIDSIISARSEERRVGKEC